MGQDLKIIGLNIGGHDGGCALLIGDQIQYAIAEERLNRYKYSPGWIASLFYCLRAAHIKLEEIDRFVFSVYGEPLPQGFHGELSSLGVDPNKCITADHHFSHALSAFVLSCFDEALIVVMDGLGNNNETESYYVANHKKIERIGGNNPNRRYWKGIGTTYEAFTNFLGFSDLEAGKVMALASYGDPNYYRIPLFKVDRYQVDSELESNHQRGVLDFSQRLRLGFGEYFPSNRSEIAWHIAAYIQDQTELTIVQLIKNLMGYTGQTNICLSGGVALNCVANSRIRQELNLTNLFILPFASDTGQAIGNAYYGYYNMTGELPKQELRNCFFGKTYSEGETLAGLKRKPGTVRYDRILRYRFGYEKQSDIASTAAELLAAGHIIGWCQGGSEIGPRALGHRSILADPSSGDIRNRLNQRVKHREWFRPFAPSILAETISQFTDVCSPSPFMLEAPPIRSDAQSKIQGAMHVDGTARVQVVDQNHDPLYHRLITEFEKRTGIPAILNTSFNDREPIVETPGDALVTFQSIDLDYLIIGEYLVSKTERLV